MRLYACFHSLVGAFVCACMRVYMHLWLRGCVRFCMRLCTLLHALVCAFCMRFCVRLYALVHALVYVLAYVCMGYAALSFRLPLLSRMETEDRRGQRNESGEKVAHRCRQSMAFPCRCAADVLVGQKPARCTLTQIALRLIGLLVGGWLDGWFGEWLIGLVGWLVRKSWLVRLVGW